jgi:hypothetical protein
MTGATVAIVLAFTGAIYLTSIGMAIGMFKLAEGTK